MASRWMSGPTVLAPKGTRAKKKSLNKAMGLAAALRCSGDILFVCFVHGIARQSSSNIFIKKNDRAREARSCFLQKILVLVFGFGMLAKNIYVSKN